MMLCLHQRIALSQELSEMPYNVDWLIKDRLILAVISSDLTLEDIAAFNQSVTALLDAGHAPIYMLADVKDLGKFPFDLISVRRASTYLQHPKLGLVMAYGASRIASSFAQLLTQIAGVKLRFVQSYADALKHLMAEDAEIKALVEANDLPMTL
jgi:hypothetical protein